jgi:hypothetical protein
VSEYDALAEAFERVTGLPLDGDTKPRRVQTTNEWEAECQRAERGQDRLSWAGYATDREMDGAAADYMYGREPAGDWRRP